MVKIGTRPLGSIGVRPQVYIVDFGELAHLNNARRQILLRGIVRVVDHRSILGCNDRHDNAPNARGSWARVLRRRILLVKPDPGVRIIRLRVGARRVEHALDSVCGAGDVGPASDIRECRSDQH